jgi:hypothetical protein
MSEPLFGVSYLLRMGIAGRTLCSSECGRGHCAQIGISMGSITHPRPGETEICNVTDNAAADIY